MHCSMTFVDCAKDLCNIEYEPEYFALLALKFKATMQLCVLSCIIISDCSPCLYGIKFLIANAFSQEAIITILNFQRMILFISLQ